MRCWIATRLRHLADRLDERGAVRYSSYSFRYDPEVKTYVMELGGHGCPILFFARDYDRMWDQYYREAGR